MLKVSDILVPIRFSILMIELILSGSALNITVFYFIYFFQDKYFGYLIVLIIFESIEFLFFQLISGYTLQLNKISTLCKN